MRMAYYPSDFIGHELRYSCENCTRRGSIPAADALARYGNRRCLSFATTSPGSSDAIADKMRRSTTSVR